MLPAVQTAGRFKLQAYGREFIVMFKTADGVFCKGGIRRTIYKRRKTFLKVLRRLKNFNG